MTSKPIAWKQPPKKEVDPVRAKDTNFVKLSHSDTKQEEAYRNSLYKCHKFDPRQVIEHLISKESLHF